MDNNDQPSGIEDQLREALLAGNTDGMSAWRMNLDVLNGWVRVAVEQGWPEMLARELVFEQARTNLRIQAATIELQHR